MFQFNLVWLIFVSINLNAQILISPQVLGALPTELQESSGLLFQNKDTLWSHNDSGNGSSVYAFNMLGQKLQEHKFSKISHEDWEEITKDEKGNIYLGDFGNNNNDRKNLLILRFTSGFTNKKQALKVDSIQFVYEDQYFFPPPTSSLNFDCEAMVVMKDTIFLFTKDRTSPYKSQTLLYYMPATPGEHVAKYKASFKTLFPIFLQGSVTGAALSQNKNKLILLGYSRMWLFTDFIGTDFFNGKVTTFQFLDYSQKEAVAFIDDCNILLTDEVNTTLSNGGNLYALDLCKTVFANERISDKNPQVFYNAVHHEIQITESDSFNGIQIFNMEGKLILSQKYDKSNSSIQIKLPPYLSTGIYFYSLLGNSTSHNGKFYIEN